MSDRVTNAEVSDDARATLRLMGSKARKTPRTPTGDRLILTPQLRVGDTGVLRLMPEDAVPARDASDADDTPAPVTQSPPSASDTKASQTRGRKSVETLDPKADVLVLTSPIKQSARSKPTDVSDLKAKITALETAIARTVDQWEPDGSSNDPYAGTQALSMDWPEDETTPFDQLVRGPATRTALTDAVQTAVSGQVMDEKALRSIVADIVKSELQGELGDRITRNVRNLVRREIHRALSAKSFL